MDEIIKHLLVVQDVPANVSLNVSVGCFDPSIARRAVIWPLSLSFIKICERRKTASGSRSLNAIGLSALYVEKILVSSFTIPAVVAIAPSVFTALLIEISALCRGGGLGVMLVALLLS